MLRKFAYFQFAPPKPFHAYVDLAKFPAGQPYVVYSSTEARSIRLTALAYVSFLSYNLYAYLRNAEAIAAAEDQLTLRSLHSDQENTLLLSSLLALGLLAFHLKTSRTVKLILLHPNGRDTSLVLHRFLGLSQRLHHVPVSRYRGFAHFLHKALRIPVFKYHSFSSPLESTATPASQSPSSSRTSSSRTSKS